MNDTILRGLNPAQREAVIHYDVPSLIIAGAGSGKTRVLTARIAYMLEQGVAPHQILALTFTNKAASEMRTRIDTMVPAGRSRFIRMGTFHSVFARILRENAQRIGFPESFTIYEPSDSRNLLKSILRELNLGEEQYKPAALAARISFAKNSLVTPGAYLANPVYATEDRHAKRPEFGNIYNLYCQRCQRNGAMDFDDLLLQTNILLRDCPDVLARYQEQFQYILVDEYQDTNYAQYIIIRRLAQHHSRVCVVGDDAQSIYSFRGAKIENILSFRNDFPDAMVFKLEQNYRSTRTIVDAANSVIEHNARRMQKRCFSEGPAGEKIRIVRAYTDREEADLVVGDLRNRVRASGDAWSEAVILYRTNNQSLVLEENLRRRGIPYRIYKGSSFYDHKEVKDLLAYIRLIVNPRDDEAFRRIVNYPARGIGNTTVERIAGIAAGRGVSMWEAVDALAAETAADPVQRAIARKVQEFVQLIHALSLARSQMGLYDFGFEIASRSGILAAYRSENTPEAASALDNIEEVLNTMQLFREQRDAEIRNGERQPGEEATIEEWLQGVMLMTDMDRDDPEDRNKVTLMTVHSAKGLEFKYVYIVGLEENLFPSQRAVETPEGMEEERRLFYVALTRAKLTATLSYAETRFKWGSMEFSRPSCFLREIDPQFLDLTFDPDSGSGFSERAGGFAGGFAGGRAEGSGGRFGGYAGRRGGAGAAGDRTAARSSGSWPGGRSGAGYGSGYGADRERGKRPDGPSAIEELRRRFDYRFQQGAAARSGAPQPSQPAAPTPRPTEGMRRIGVRPAGGESPAAAPSAPAPVGGYEVGQRVAHDRFGQGTIRRIETLAGDQKLVVAFDHAGEKTLLAKFARLTRL